MPHRELPDTSLSYIGNALLRYLCADAVPASRPGRCSPSLMHKLGVCSACTVIGSRTPPCLAFVFLLAAVCCTRCTGQPTMCYNTTGSSKAPQGAALNSHKGLPHKTFPAAQASPLWAATGQLAPAPLSSMHKPAAASPSLLRSSSAPESISASASKAAAGPAAR